MMLLEIHVQCDLTTSGSGTTGYGVVNSQGYGFSGVFYPNFKEIRCQLHRWCTFSAESSELFGCF